MFKTELAASLHKIMSALVRSRHGKTWQLHRVRASCLTTQPCMLQVLWPPCSNYNEKNFLRGFNRVCVLNQNASSQVGTWLSFSENGGYTAQTRLSTRRNCCLIATLLRSTGINTFNIAMILEEDGSRYVLVFFFYVGDAGNTSLVDAGTPLGATAVVTSGSAGYLLWGVLHPGVPVMWYGHIRDLFPTAEGCMGSRMPNVTRLHWAQQE